MPELNGLDGKAYTFKHEPIVFTFHEKSSLNPSTRCSLCGKPLKQEHDAAIHFLITGEICHKDDNDVAIKSELSQGCFPIGPDCAKKLPEGYSQ